MSTDNPLDDIAANVAGLDLWQTRDWPHRRGDDISFDLLQLPLMEDSPGRRSHACENCGQDCLCIHDNVMCWKCKSAFCLHCTCNPDLLMTMPLLDVIVKQGFAKCHSCQEPLRSIGMIAVFRGMMEGMAVRQSRNADFLSGTGFSLVQEAEDALARGQACSADPQQAILEYTHAINAINYLASSTSGTRLVLRAVDILLIAHGKRAELEDNAALFDSIVAAYPKASVRSARSNEQVWYLSSSAYETLFYPLQANLVAGSRSHGGLILIDQRNQSCQASFESPELQTQIALAGYDSDAYLNPMFKKFHPHCDGRDAEFDSLGGMYGGLTSYAPNLSQAGPVPGVVADSPVDMFGYVQFIRVFPTDLAAVEYTRVTIATKNIGEENPPISAEADPRLTSMVKQCAKECGVKNLHKTHVIHGTPFTAVSVVAAVGNVFTKIFIHLNSDDSEQVVCFLAGRALSYLERQLLEYRATSSASTRKAPNYPPDLTICAYCGNGGGEDDLKSCSRCKLARFCSVDCQRKHWEMKGPFGHKRFCKSIGKKGTTK